MPNHVGYFMVRNIQKLMVLYYSPINIKLLAMENTLIMNKLPLPRYYDGDNWNTVFKPTRKSIPKYLHEDLPELKLLEIKERFKQIGKFNCPRLDYFDGYIKKHNTFKDKKPKTSRQIQDRKQSQRVTQELQYALLLCDKDSPVLDEVVGQSKNVRRSMQIKKGYKQKGRYFPNTISLVFKNRKNMYLSQQKRKHEDHHSPSAERRINDLKLYSFH